MATLNTKQFNSRRLDDEPMDLFSGVCWEEGGIIETMFTFKIFLGGLLWLAFHGITRNIKKLPNIEDETRSSASVYLTSCIHR